MTEKKLALIVEDNDADIITYQRYLSRHRNYQFTLFIAKSLDEARRKVSQLRFDIILCDHHLPDGLGILFLSEIQANNAMQFTARIFITGENDDSVALSGFDAGISGFVHKSEMSELQFNTMIHNALLRNSSYERHAKMNQHTELLSFLAEKSEDFLIACDAPTGHIVFANRPFAHWSHIPACDISTFNIRRFCETFASMTSWRALINECESRPIRRKLSFSSPVTETSITIDATFHLLSQRNTDYLVIVARDFSEHENLLNELENLSRKDELTGLSNRRHLAHHFSQLTRQASRTPMDASFIMFDIDDFKHINDRYGHDFGDEVLKFVASKVKTTCQRPLDLAARLGGEEIFICLPHTSLDDAISLAQTLAQQLAQHEPPITVSTGILYTAMLRYVSFDAIYSLVDRLMYQVKTNGKNNIKAQQLDEASLTSITLPIES